MKSPPSPFSEIRKKSKNRDEHQIWSEREKRELILEALTIIPNVRQVHIHLNKVIDVSYGTVWNIAKAHGIRLIRFNKRQLVKRSKTYRKPQQS